MRSRRTPGWPARARREFNLAKYVLMPFGLESDSVGYVTIDNKIRLIQAHPRPDLFLCPLVGTPQPSESEAWYYADCIAYEHDIPVIVLPSKTDFRRFRYRFLHSGRVRSEERTVVDVSGSGQTRHSTYTVHPMPPDEIARTFYVKELCVILDEIRLLRHGPLTYVGFRHADTNGRLNLPYARQYARTANEVHLYATALRQADALGEFLGYYRVVEGATASNGKAWIARALDRLRTHDFGFIPIAHEEDRSPRNLLGILRRRASRRLSTLMSTYQSDSEVAAYLYNVQRCGIAHGRRIVRADITPSYFEVVRDTYVMKLLARVAIDEKLP